MEKEDIRIKNVIVHIMDNTIGMPVISDQVLEFGSDFADFIRQHIYKIANGDDGKHCEFYKEQSEIYQMLTEFTEENFVETSKKIAEQLYEIMGSNIDIPSADLMIVHFAVGETQYFAILKMNYKESYTHRTMPGEEEDTNINEIIKYKTILPTEGQRLQEAAVINLDDYSVQLVEKKYEVNGEKTNYFSFLFLKCSSHLSHKAKLNIVTKAIEKVQKDNFDETEQFEQNMKAKSIIQETLQEQGGFAVEEIAEKVFEEKPYLAQEFQEKIEKYDLVKEEIKPQSESTTKKYQQQFLTTDTGIEIKIPMEQYKNKESVEFITNDDGTTSILIKNIGHLAAKM